MPLALATSTYYDRTMYRLEHSGLGRYFQAVVTGDQVSKSKPDPEIYRAACQRLGVSRPRRLLLRTPQRYPLRPQCGVTAVMIPDLIPSSPELDSLIWKKFDDLSSLLHYLQRKL